MGYEIRVHAMNANGAFRTNKVLYVHASTECTKGKKEYMRRKGTYVVYLPKDRWIHSFPVSLQA